MINFPMTVDPTSISGFDYTADTLGITPVIEQKTAIKIHTFSSCNVFTSSGVPSELETLMVESNMGGDFDTIWIGKDASINFIKGMSSYGTLRHEIRSLAFEDGRTDLFNGIKFGTIEIVEEDPGIIDPETGEKQQYSSNTHHFSYSRNPDSDGWYYIDDLSSPLYASSTDVPLEQDYYDYGEYGSAEFTITKELKLPEGITSFPRLEFGHPTSDPCYELLDGESYPSPRMRSRHDINIYIPSTISSFHIHGVNDSSVSTDSNLLYFGYDIGLPLLFSLIQEQDHLEEAGFENGMPWTPERGEYDSEEEYEAAFNQYVSDVNAILDACDHVHIYLKNHTTVPTITFSDGMYFPVVFHVNEDIYDDFVSTYQNNSVKYKVEGYYTLEGISPLTFVKTETYGGTKEVVEQTSLSETKFSGVAITGSYNDLKDKPEIPDFTDIMDITSSELHLGGMTMAADGSVTESHSDYAGATFTESTDSYTIEAFEWNLGIGLHDLESKTIKVVFDGVTYQANPIMIQDDGSVVYYLFGALSSEELAEETDQEFLRKYEERGFADFPFKMHLCIIIRTDSQTQVQTPVFAIWEGYLSESAHTLELSMVEKSEKIKSKYLPSGSGSGSGTDAESISDTEINNLFVTQEINP